VRIVPDLSVRLAETERVLVHTIARIAVLESQVKSLQMSPSLPRGIPT
jgi:hypothetical protein